MDRSGIIDRLGLQLDAQLAQATGCGDWTLLEPSVRDLAPQLKTLAARGPWNGAERAALARLRAVHARAASACDGAAAALAARLDEMRSNKEGWMAYALAGDTDMDRP